MTSRAGDTGTPLFCAQANTAYLWDLQRWPLNVIQGKDYIEVRPASVGKGRVIGNILSTMREEGNSAEFVLCIGDDVADELMFEQLNDMVARNELQQGELVCGL